MIFIIDDIFLIRENEAMLKSNTYQKSCTIEIELLMGPHYGVLCPYYLPCRPNRQRPKGDLPQIKLEKEGERKTEQDRYMERE